MSNAILYEHKHRGDVWRFEVVTHNGRTFFNCRKWYWKGDKLAATRDGFTMPPDQLSELGGALMAFKPAIDSSGA